MVRYNLTGIFSEEGDTFFSGKCIKEKEKDNSISYHLGEPIEEFIPFHDLPKIGQLLIVFTESSASVLEAESYFNEAS